MKTLVPDALALALFLLAVPCVDDLELDSLANVGSECVCRGLDGTVTPNFATAKEVRAYIDEHPDRFTEGSKILRW